MPVRFQFGPATRTVIYKLRLRQGQWLVEDIVFGSESLLKTLQRPSYAEITDPLQPVAQSHIVGNVPSPPNFEAFLKRDLAAYFKPSKSSMVTIDYEMLRREPTQSAVSLPKYYLWMKIYRGKTLREEGAARVAAMEQKGFEVMDYFSKSELAKNPQQIDATFPTLIGDKIRSRIGRK